ncbi:lipid-A-disaccharide synthase [Desulfurivibrio sp. C05AmB]|jgi:lipid-A-disaccharide synthase|uniref:lipid-A-disaccharide synthase n=1 Tax=Desulfurivibrio sp. C05AmB TaxID=3374371 RepID=UPI00376EAA57
MSVPHILIVAGEASGDMHAANLVKALHARRPEVRVSAMGGGALAAAGAELLYDSARLAVVGLIEVLSHLGEILAARRRLVNFLTTQRPDLLILVDYPDFNLLLAAAARKLGIPVFYYISPQVWAWRQGRVRKIKRLVDRMAVILPFEQEFYRKRGMEVDFVGHPLVDELAGPAASIAEAGKAAHGLAPGDERRIIGLLPGSRRREIAVMLPLFLAAARILARGRQPAPIFLLPLAPGLDREVLTAGGLDQYGDLDIRISEHDRHGMMAACHAVMAASGTVTLELALLGVPMVAAYRVSSFTYLVGRLLVDVPHATLVNLVAGREVIPELIQDRAEAALIGGEVAALLDNSQRRQTMLHDLAEVRQKLGRAGASQRAAAIALELLDSAGREEKAANHSRKPA